MVGTLIGELFRAIPRFIAFRARRVFGHTNDIAPPTEVVSPAEVATLQARTGPTEACLNPKFLQSVAWHADASPMLTADAASSALFTLWKTIPEGHKWSHYFATYEAAFGAEIARPLRVLELGVYRGSSIALWKKYFAHPDTVIVGIDIDPACLKYDNPADRIHVRIGSQDDGEFLASVTREFGPVDIIIDDGSHTSSHMIASFNILFMDALAESGIYLVEDLHANYWRGYRNSEMSFLDLCKQLVELMHHHYARAGGIQPFWPGLPRHQPIMDVPLITTMLREIRFFDSIVVLYKKPIGTIPSVLFMGNADTAAAH